MSTELTYEQALDLLPLYALGALEPEEMLALEAALNRHAELRARLRELEATTALLAHSAPHTPLPTAARQQLLERVRADRAEDGRRQTADGRRQTANPELETQNPIPGTRYPIPDTRYPIPDTRIPNPRSPIPNPLAWALLALVLVLGAYTLQLRSEVARLNGTIAGLQQSNQVLLEQLEQNERQLAMLTEPDRSVQLASTREGQAARGAFYLRGDEGVVVVSGLEPLPAQQTYQLWLVPPGGTPTSVALLPPAQGNATLTLTVAVPPELRNFAIVDISIEPAGGSPQITKETIVLRGTI